MVTFTPAIEFDEKGCATLRGGATLGQLLARTADHLERFVERVGSCRREGKTYSLNDLHAGRLHGIAELWRQCTLLAQMAQFAAFPQERFRAKPNSDCEIIRDLRPHASAKPVVDILTQLLFMLPGYDGTTWIKSVPQDVLVQIEGLTRELKAWAAQLSADEAAQDEHKWRTAQAAAISATCAMDADLSRLSAGEERSNLRQRRDSLFRETLEAHGFPQPEDRTIYTAPQLLTEIERRSLTNRMAAMAISRDEDADRQQLVDFACLVAAENGWTDFPCDSTGTSAQQLARIQLWCTRKAASLLKQKQGKSITGGISCESSQQRETTVGWTARELCGAKSSPGSISPSTFHLICEAAGVACGPSGDTTHCYDINKLRTLARVARQKSAGKRKWFQMAEKWDRLLACPWPRSIGS